MFDPASLLLAAILSVSVAAAGLGMARQSRSQERQLKEHPVRRRILGTLKVSPGASITDLRREVGIGWGTVQHHLYLLRQAGVVKGVVHGRSHRFYRTDAPEDDGPTMALLRRGRLIEVAKAIVRQPGVRQQQLTRSIEISRKVFRRYADLLADAGLVKEVREAKYRRYYPTADLIDVLDAGSPSAEGDVPPANGTVRTGPNP